MLNSELCNRLNEEYTLFKTNLLKQSSEQVFNSAYEIIYKEEIFDILSREDFSDDIISYLLSQTNIMDYIYQLWLRNDYSSMEKMRGVIRSIKQNTV